jgi:hypothetical protein
MCDTTSTGLSHANDSGIVHFAEGRRQNLLRKLWFSYWHIWGKPSTMVEQSCGLHSNTYQVNPPQLSSNQDSINLIDLRWVPSLQSTPRASQLTNAYYKICVSQLINTYHEIREHILSTQYVQKQLLHII